MTAKTKPAGGDHPRAGSGHYTPDHHSTPRRYAWIADPHDVVVELLLDVAIAITGHLFAGGELEHAQEVAATHRQIHRLRTPRGRWTGPIARRLVHEREARGVRA